jgi:hypothetical protein
MQRNNIISECIDVVRLTKAYISSFQISLTQQIYQKNMHDIYSFLTCEAMCGKTTMDKFHVCVLMVEVALDETMDYFVLDSFSADRLGYWTQYLTQNEPASRQVAKKGELLTQIIP